MSDDLLRIPFVQFLGIRRGGTPGALRLSFRPEFANHLGQWAGGIGFSLAEAAGGDFLLQRFPQYAGRVLPLLREARVRWRRPATGPELDTVVATEVGVLEGFEQRLRQRRRATVNLQVTVRDGGVAVLEGDFQWHVTMTDNARHEPHER